MLPVKPLPVDHRGGAVHLVETRQAVVSQLSREQTQALLQEAPGVYHTRINEVLLTCLAQVLSQWTGARRVMVDLEGHGREQVEALEGSVDVSRTVGWFTTIFPVALELGAAGSGIGDELKRVKEQLRAIPGRGIGHGWLRYARSGEAGERMRRMAEAEVSFNYLGQVDQVLEPGGIFSEAGESGGATRSKKGKRSHQLEITAIVKGGRLVLQWTYSPEAHERRTIEELAGRFEEAVERVIEHCREPEAGGYTPSDFPLARLTQEEVDRLVKAEREVEGIYRLSPLQQGLLFHTLYEPGSGQYFERTSCLLRGLEVGAFQKAWATVVKRHPALRTSFHWEGLNETVQVVHRRVDLPWEEGDWRELSDAERRERLKRHLEEDRQRGFRLDQAPLMRMGLMRVDEEGYYFIWSHHHVLLDGWSAALVVKEVFVYYEAYRQGREMELEQPRAYSDYIEWLERQDREKAESYWRRALKGFQTPTALRVADNRRASGGYQSQRITLSEGMSERLRAVARGHQLTLNTLAQGAWAVLLSRYSGEEDVVFGATVSGRESGLTGIESMVGVFINTLPVRVRVRGGREVSGLLKQLQEEQAEARQYEYSSLAEVQKWSETVVGERLFESLLAYENYPVDRAMLEEARQGRVLEVREVRGEERTNYPLTVAAWAGQRMELRLTYQERRYDEVVMGRMAGHLRRLLEGLGEEAEQKVSELRMLSAEEEHQLCFEWNQTAREYPFEKCIHQLFEEQVERTPEAIAVVQEDQQVNYRELNARANQLAHYLRRVGVGPEDVVALALPRSLEMAVALLGVWKAGGAYVALDPSYPEQRLRWMMEDAAASVALTGGAAREALGAGQVRVIDFGEEWTEVEKCGRENPRSGVSGDNLAYVIYTSGSTGEPKGVMVAHRSLTNVLKGSRRNFHFGAGEEMLCLASFSFDISLFELMNPIVTGGKVNILSRERVLNMGRLLDELKKAGVIHAVPTLMRQIIEGIKQEPANKQDYGNVEKVFVGGESVPPDLLREMGAIFKAARIEALYGPTEGTIICASERVEPSEVRERNPIGKPLDNVRIELRDRNSQLAPIGVAGELWIGGAGVARGHLKRPELTAERFIPESDGLESGARMYRTGDLARRREDGNLEFLGRTAHQIKVRGYRIEPGEIEAALKQHSSIRQALVIAREEAPGEKRLVAYLIGNPEQAPSVSELKHFLKERLPEYLVPSAFMALDEFPLTPNGKVDRRALPAPESPRRESDENYQAPRNPVEEILAGIWSEVLRLERLGTDDNFFELGGDSILSIQIIARARQAGLDLTPKHIFQHQTIAQLAQVITAASEQRALTDQAPVSGELPLTPIQQWFFAQQPTEPDNYNQSVLLRVETELEIEFLARIVRELLSHHDGLRLRFAHTAQGWRQFNAAVELNQVFSIIDLAAAAPERQSGLIEGAAEQAQRSLNLSEGPLARVIYFDCGRGRAGRLLMVIHHLAVDGVSWRILLEDLQRGYEQWRAGQSVRLPAKTSSFKQWAERMRAEVEAGLFDHELSYWTRMLPVKPLPVDHRGGAVHLVETRQAVVSQLSREQTQALLQEAPGVYHTRINEVLLTCLAQVLSQWTGTRRVMVDLEGHGREQVEALEGSVDVSRTVGWFTTIFPVALELGAAGSGIGDELKRVKEQLRAIPGRGIGHGWLRYARSGEAGERMRRMAEAEVSFNYLGQVDQVLEPGGIFSEAGESGGATRSKKGKRSHQLEITAIVKGGRLVLQWIYSPEAHERRTIEELAGRFEEAVERVIEHCREPEAGGYTPSDFPLARLTQEEVDRLVKAEREVEGIYRLSPLQQGLLFHTLYEPGSGQYFERTSCLLRGLEVGAFQKAWATVVKRHPALRTSFHWEGLNETVQVVHRRVDLPWEEGDWRELSDAERRERLKRHLEEDRQRGFRLDQAPLMRMGLMRVDEEGYYFIWSHHHVLLDGWSAALVIKEVFVYYEAYRQGREMELEQPRAYSDYIEWLERQDREKAESYWRRALKGFQTPTALRVADNRRASGGYQSQRITLSEGMSERLRAVARGHQLTLNTLAQGAWAVLLSRYSGEEDVVFGATVSGRESGLTGIESMVGVFINTLPVRVRVRGGREVSGLLKQLQEEQAEARQYEYSSLAEVQKWSETDRKSTRLNSS